MLAHHPALSFRRAAGNLIISPCRRRPASTPQSANASRKIVSPANVFCFDFSHELAHDRQRNVSAEMTGAQKSFTSDYLPAII